MTKTTEYKPVTVVSLLNLSTFLIMTVVVLVSALLVEIADEFHTTVAIAGQLITITAIVWGLSAPAIGPLSDHLGRKRVLLIGLTVAGFSILGYSLAWSYPVLIVLSIFAGLGGAMTGPVILAFVGDYFPPKILGRMIALVGAGVPIAHLLGAPGGTLIAGSAGWRTSFLVLAILLLALALLCFMKLPSQKIDRTGSSFAYLSSFKTALKLKAFLPLLTANVLASCGYSAVYSYLPAFLIQSYSLSLGQAAPLLLFVAIGDLCGMLLGGQLADKFDRNNVCTVTQALTAIVGMMIMWRAYSLWLTVFMGALLTGLFDSNRPSFVSINSSLSSTIRGTIMGIQGASNHLGRALGAMVGGLVLGFAGYHYMGITTLVACLSAAILFYFSRPTSEN
jgi:predicted MFS family arabinose efflux permease